MPNKRVYGLATWCAQMCRKAKKPASASDAWRFALAVRSNIVSVTDIDWTHVRLLQRSDGCRYAVSASPVNPQNPSNLPA
jgi:hypothetical protein